MHKEHSITHVILLMVLYFVGYLILLPAFLTKVTLLIDPYATQLHPTVLLFGYCLFLIIIIYLSRKEIKKGFLCFKQNFKKCLYTMIRSSIFILLVNLILSFIVAMIFDTNGSINQQSIESQSRIYPSIIIFVTCIFAPIVEECIFRGSLFAYFLDKKLKLMGIVFSSFLFGFIHVMDSLFAIGASEIGYMCVYTMMGFVLAKAYDASHSLVVCIFIHMINNIVACSVLYG